MNQESANQNIMTLAALINGDEHKAQELLSHSIAIVFDERDGVQNQLAVFLFQFLERTFETVQLNPDDPTKFAHIISLSSEVRGDESLFAIVSDAGLSVGPDPIGVIKPMSLKPIHLFLSAGYTAAQVAWSVVGEYLPFTVPKCLSVSFAEVFGDDFPFDQETDIGETFLAGAGAIGNSFVAALQLLQPRGKLYVADPDKVDGGNLNRCILFSEDDIGQYKADVLASKPGSDTTSLELIPRRSILEKVPERNTGNWLKRLVVAADSRRVRRHLQNELPGEVFDASTTDIREFVLHFNKQPLDDQACLSCIYFSDEAEKSHEAHVAEVLGLTVDQVESNFVTPAMALKIREKYPELNQDPTGLACDSLFKQLCGEGKLKAAEDRQVLAPFAFVSVLAGTFLAAELVKRLSSGNTQQIFNYWRVSPWNEPVLRGQRLRKTNPNCEFCGGVAKEIGTNLWK